MFRINLITAKKEVVRAKKNQERHISRFPLTSLKNVMQEAWQDWHRKSWSSWGWSLSPPCLSSPCWRARSPRPGGGPLQLSLPGSRVPGKVRCLWKTFNYNDSLHLAISQITLPPSKSLYLSMALCVNHLVGGGDPIYAAVNSSDHCCGLEWPIWPIFFAKCKFYICCGAVKKISCIFGAFLPPKLTDF